MTLRAALALCNIIDANYRIPSETEDLFDSLNFDAADRMSILTLSTNFHKNVELNSIYDAIGSTKYNIILKDLPSRSEKNCKYADSNVQRKQFCVENNDDNYSKAVRSEEEQIKPQPNEQVNGALNIDEIHEEPPQNSTHLQSECLQKLYYQGRNILELDVHLRTSWMSFSTAQVDCNTLSVENFLLNRGQVSRIANMWPPNCYFKNCIIKDCAFTEYLYQ